MNATSQQATILTALRQGPVSTFYARTELDVLHPAMRICELRNAGHRIDTVWEHVVTECGRRTRIARYCLVGEAGATNGKSPATHGPMSKKPETSRI